MKIAIVDVHYGNSGTGKIMAALHGRLTEQGHDVAAFYGRSSGVELPEAKKIAPNWEVYKHAALARLTGRNGSYSPRATEQLLQMLDNFQPDVVHLHELHGYYINVLEVVKYLVQKKIPVVWTFHCEYMYTGKCGHTHECEQWLTRCNVCPQLHTYPASWYFDRVGVMFDEKRATLALMENLLIVTPSRWLADRVKRSFLMDRPLTVVHNGIDVNNTFYPRETTALRIALGIENCHVVLSAAMNLMDEIKGGVWIQKVAERFVGTAVKFLMVGMPDQIEGLPENVIALPATTNQSRLAEYYSVADMFFLASRKETFSLVCAESLACGTPIVGFEAGAPAEVAPQGYGRFFPYGDVDSVVACIERNLESSCDFRSPEQCVIYARENFGEQVMVEKYMDCYKQVIHAIN